MPIPDLSALVVSTIVPFVLKLVGAVALWIAGGWLIQLAMRIMPKSLRSSSLDVTVVGYLINILAAVLRVILVVAILGFFGIQTASFAALLAGALWLNLATAVGAPVSTSHVVASSIMGIGASERPRSVRWGKAGEIVATWVITIPASAAAGALVLLLLRPLLA